MGKAIPMRTTGLTLEQICELLPENPTYFLDADLHAAASWDLADPSFAVEQIMAQSLVTVTPETRVRDAEYIAGQEGIHHLLVVDSEQPEKLLGVLCKHDLAQADGNETIGKYMSSVVSCIGPRAALDQAAEIMREQAIGCLPVLAGEALVGIVTQQDLQRAGLPAEQARGPFCSSCRTAEHVRLAPGGVPLCTECMERAHPPEPFEDVGVGD